MTAKKSVRERFLEKVDTGEPDECWEWEGARNADGYGSFRVRGRVVGAHRVAFRLDRGRPAEDQVNHHCDNRGCVNPWHLYEGSQLENIRDMAERGRSTAGEEHPHAKLTESQVVEIRHRYADGATQPELADEYSVEKPTIQHIVEGYSWQGAGGPITKRGRPEGEKNPASKFTNAEVKELRQHYARGGATQQELRDEYGVSRRVIGLIIRGESYSTAEGPVKGEDYTRPGEWRQ